MSFLKLKDKSFLVTGASSGIGQKTAELLSQQGAKLLLSGRNKERLGLTRDLLEGEGHDIFIGDLSDEEMLADLINQCAQLDGIVHCAGVIKPFPIKFITKKQITEMFKINFEISVELTSGLLRKKKINKAASIVFMSSVSSRFAHKGGALYSASKAAVNAYSRSVAIECAHQKIRSNVISAAMVKTPIFDQAELAVTKEVMDVHEKSYPLGFGDPTDVANAIMYLLSDASKWTTGTTLVLDGGLTAGQ